MESLWLGTWAKFLLRTRLGPYVPTPHHVCSRLLKLAKVQPTDKVFDIGCGDGRLVVSAAATFGARGVGLELDPSLVQLAREKVKAQGVEHLVEIKSEDAREADLSSATLVTMYLSERGNLEMLPRLQSQMPPKSRVATFTFPIPGLKPATIEHVDGVALYIYHVPLEP
mmetsp:Transcript_19554/g.23450  ORF Transcript_19554/g.23450 Transcript_19554/m.23450 type:complete len:169 (-) Transcript_19554:146-652(-)